MKPSRMTLDEIVDRIVEEKGLSRKQVFDLIEKKKTLLSRMISDEGAADIVAKELGVKARRQYDDEELALTVADLVAGMSNVTITGRVMNINPIREFTDKMGSKSYVCNLVIADKSGNMRLVLWGDLTNPVRDGKIKQGAIVRISGGYVKEDIGGRAELHAGRRGHVDTELQDVDRIDLPEMAYKPRRVADLRTNMAETDFTGMVKETIPARTTKTRDGREVTLSSLVAEDDSGATIRVVFWNEEVSSMGNMKKGDKIEITSGRVRVNKKGEIEIHVGPGTTVKVGSPQSEINIRTIHETRRIGELRPGIQDYPIEGIIAGTPRFRVFKQRDGTDGKLISFTLSDGTSAIRTVAWGDDAEKLRILKNGDLIRIKESAVKPGIGGEHEIHVKRFEILGSSGQDANTGLQAEHCENEFGSAPTDLARRKNVSDLKDGEIAEIRGMITSIQTKSPIYRACPKCLRKVEMKDGQWYCPKDGDVGNPEVRTLYSLTLDDGTGAVTCVLSGCFGEGLLGAESSELLASGNATLEDGTAILSSLLGLEIIFIGKSMFNPRQRRNEFRVSGFTRPDPRIEANLLLEQIRKDLGA